MVSIQGDHMIWTMTKGQSTHRHGEHTGRSHDMEQSTYRHGAGRNQAISSCELLQM